MQEHERQECRRTQKHKEMMKNPGYRMAYEAGQRKAAEQKRMEETLKRFEAGYVPLIPDTEPQKKTVEELRIEEQLKNFM